MSLNYETTISYTPCPEGSYPAICIQVVELGMQPGYQGGPDKAQVYLAFETVGTERDDGQPHVLGKRYTVTLFEKGNLYAVIHALLGRVPPAREFNPEALLGKACLAQVVHRERADGSVNAVVSSVVPMPKGMGVPTPENDLLFYDWTRPNKKVKATLPEWLQKTIDQGTDQPKQKIVKNAVAAGQDFDVDIEFDYSD